MDNAIAHQQDQPRKTRRLKIFFWILILLAGAEFVARGPARFLLEPGTWNDFSQGYTASRLWLRGQSPSDPRNFVALWRQEGNSHLEFNDIRAHLAPPLGALVILAPIAAFHWSIAKIIWMAVLLIAFATTVLALATAGGFRHDELRVLAFIAACLALAPYHTGLASGNATVLVIGACVAAVWAAHNRRDLTAGILFAVACSLKPQIGGLFVLYYLVRRRWRLFATALATTIALALVALLQLQLRGASWSQDYVHNATRFFTANNIDDFSAANPIRFTLINLQVPFSSITGDFSSANRLAFAAGALLMSVWLYLVIRGREERWEFLPLGAISIIGLLPVYHRFYDAGLLVVPLCWCMTQKIGRAKSTAKTVLFLMIPFLAPGAAFLQQLVGHNRVPAAVAHSWWWNCVVMPHETWVILLLSLVLLYGMSLRTPIPNPEVAALPRRT
jgi:hypothetical protein